MIIDVLIEILWKSHFWINANITAKLRDSRINEGIMRL